MQSNNSGSRTPSQRHIPRSVLTQPGDSRRWPYPVKDLPSMGVYGRNGTSDQLIPTTPALVSRPCMVRGNGWLWWCEITGMGCSGLSSLPIRRKGITYRHNGNGLIILSLEYRFRRAAWRGMVGVMWAVVMVVVVLLASEMYSSPPWIEVDRVFSCICYTFFFYNS